MGYAKVNLYSVLLLTFATEVNQFSMNTGPD